MVTFAITLIVIVGFVVALVYLQFPPKYANKEQTSAFNKMVLGVTLVLCAVIYFQGRQSLPFSDSIRGAVALLLSVAGEVVLLGIFFLIRNFWIFKKPKRPGGMF